MTLVRISSTEYEDFRRFLEEACGILLGDNKHYLVQSRLGRMVNDNGVASLGDLVAQLRRERSGGPLREKVIEAMTTNETFWFRDNHPFQILSERILPEYTQRKQRSARVWSAACSTGQEPYSISITVQEFLSKNPGSLSDVQIVATVEFGAGTGTNELLTLYVNGVQIGQSDLENGNDLPTMFSQSRDCDSWIPSEQNVPIGVKRCSGSRPCS